MSKSFKVSMLAQITKDEITRYVHERFILTLGNAANKFDVKQELIRRGYRGEILSIEELKA